MADKIKAPAARSDLPSAGGKTQGAPDAHMDHGAQQPPAQPEPENVRASAIPISAGITADERIAAAMPSVPDPVENPQAYADYIQSIRARRTTFGISAQKLALPERRGYHRHWFNDSPGRIEEALNAGWAHVADQKGSPVSRIVGTGRDNKALRGFAMEMPTPIWEEDQAVVHKAAQDRLDQVKGAGAFRAKPGMAKRTDEQKFYSPGDGAPITVSESIVRG